MTGLEVPSWGLALAMENPTLTGNANSSGLFQVHSSDIVTSETGISSKHLPFSPNGKAYLEEQGPELPMKW